ncbi:MAG: 50S ribosomal protein L13 [Deltaproteobacteria bacterium]|nr:50S ribosomal protein L13 [Deltaproteobacteria bacterium]
MKTYQARKGEIERPWFVVDLDGKVLGRAASKIAMALRGKDRPIFTPHVDTGAFVVCINAAKVKLTGNKLDKKSYYHYTGYPGGIKEETAGELLAKKPEEIIRRAVRGMLPRNRLGRQLLNKLKVYAGPEHPHQAQQPKPLDF